MSPETEYKDAPVTPEQIAAVKKMLARKKGRRGTQRQPVQHFRSLPSKEYGNRAMRRKPGNWRLRPGITFTSVWPEDHKERMAKKKQQRAIRKVQS